MHTKILILALPILVLLSLIHLSAQTATEGVVNVKTASVYEKPDAQSKVLRSLSKNIKVNILQEDGGFYNIEVKGKTGWVKKSSIKQVVSATPTESATPPPETKTSKRKTIPAQPVEKKEKPKEEEKSEISNSSGDSPNIYPKRKKYKLGVNLGASMANLSGSDAPSGIASRTGLTVGAFYQRSIIGNTDLLSWRVELRYNQKGGTSGDTTYRFDYIELPVLFCLVINTGKISPFLTLGPTIAYNSNSGMKTKDSTYKIDDIKKLDVNVSVGAGLSYQLSQNFALELDIRYLMGLTTIHDKTVHNLEKEMNIKDNTILLILGVSF